MYGRMGYDARIVVLKYGFSTVREFDTLGPTVLPILGEFLISKIVSS